MIANRFQSTPSIRGGFARSAAEANYPGLWRSLIASWAPALGHTGNKVFDWGAGNNDGVLTNMVPSSDWVIAGGDNLREPSYVLDFDGDNDWLELGSITSNNPLSLSHSGHETTFAFWFKHNAAGDDFQRLLDKSDGGSGANGYSLMLQNDVASGFGPAEIILSVATGTRYRSGANAYTVGEWTHAVLLYSAVSARIRLFVNGVENTAGTPTAATIPGTTTNARICTWNHSTGREFGGQLAELSLWSRHLSVAEIGLLYGTPLALFHQRRFSIGKVPAPPGGLSIPIAMHHYKLMAS